MSRWSDGAGLKRWGLSEAGVQYLVFIGTRGPLELDLSAESGRYAVNSVHLQTGEVVPTGEAITAGSKVDLGRFLNAGQTVLWLKKE